MCLLVSPKGVVLGLLLALDGRCKSFGAEGDGYGRGEITLTI